MIECNDVVVVEPKTLAERIDALKNDPTTMQTICDNVAEGGSLLELCETWDVRYGIMCRWINADQTRFKQYREALDHRAEWTEETVLRELRGLGTIDLTKILDKDGNVKDPSTWPEGMGKAIASIEVFEQYEGAGNNREYVGRTKKVKLWDKTKSLEMLGKNLRMFIDRKELSLSKTLEDFLQESHNPKEK